MREAVQPSLVAEGVSDNFVSVLFFSLSVWVRDVFRRMRFYVPSLSIFNDCFSG